MDDICPYRSMSSKMDIVCMVDTSKPINLHQRKALLEEIKKVCTAVDANIRHVSVS